MSAPIQRFGNTPTPVIEDNRLEIIEEVSHDAVLTLLIRRSPQAGTI